MDNPGAEYINDLEIVVSVLTKSTATTLQKAARRCTYKQPATDILPMVTFTRAEKKLMFTTLAIYGNALLRSMALVSFQLGVPPLPCSLFVLLSTLAAAEAVPVIVVAQTNDALRGLICGLKMGGSEIASLQSDFSAAFLEKTYTDVDS